MQVFDRQSDTLAATDAERDDATLETIAFHWVDQLCGQHCAGGANRMAVGDGAAFHIDDVVRQSELARDHNRDRGESFIDLDPLDRAMSQPARCSACLTAGTGPSPKMPGSTAAIRRRRDARLRQRRASRPMSHR